MADEEPKTEQLALSCYSEVMARKFKGAFERSKVLHTAARGVG